MKNYIKSFFKYYLSKKTKLILIFILTVIVYLWINKITGDIANSYNQFYQNPSVNLMTLGDRGTALYLLFIKPIFVYIAGLIIIKYI
ncbi:hypothetical protein KJ840_00875 [Patescibacteria group bacterium]|nr:hypothetical protein [Patescibacteria group bacterium]